MSYRLRAGESVAEGIKRIAAEQIDRALERAIHPSESVDVAVHEVRVHLKRLRALIRLAYGELEPALRRSENLCYRDAGRALADPRRAAAMLEALALLRQRYPGQSHAKTFEPARRFLAGSRTHGREERARALREAAGVLKGARTRIAGWGLHEHNFAGIAPGVERTYRQGRRAAKEALKTLDAEALHEWRKQVRYLWFQLRILREIWPEAMRRSAWTLRSVSDCLDQDHDLALLRDDVVHHLDGRASSKELKRLTRLIDARRLELEKQAAYLGPRIYAEKPKPFAARIEAYWTAWRRESAS